MFFTGVDESSPPASPVRARLGDDDDEGEDEDAEPNDASSTTGASISLISPLAFSAAVPPFAAASAAAAAFASRSAAFASPSACSAFAAASTALEGSERRVVVQGNLGDSVVINRGGNDCTFD